MKDDYQAIMVTPEPKLASFQQMELTSIQLPNQLLSYCFARKVIFRNLSEQMHKKQSDFMEKIILEKLTWLQQFATGDNEPVMRTSALKNGEKVGAYNPLGEVIWLDKALLVVPIKDENTDKLLKVLYENEIAEAFTTVQECDATKAR